MRAGDRRRDVRLEDVATRAGVHRPVVGPAGFASAAVDPSRLLASASAGRSYQLTGKVVDGSIRKQGDATLFRVRDRNGSASVPVRYVGAVPDPFRDGREVIVTVRKRGSTFVGERDSLVTKCPSKFTDKQQS